MGVLFEDIWLNIVLGFTVFAVLFYRFWTHNYSYWKDQGVPYIEPSFPFGNIADYVLVRGFSGSVFKDLYFKLKGHKYGGILTLRRPDIVLVDTELIKHVLTKDFLYFSSRGRTVHEDADPLLIHLFNLEGERWRILRMKLSPTFTSGKMKMMFHLMKACAQTLQKNVEEHAEREDTIEVKDVMMRFATDVIGSCAFGLDIDSLNNPNCDFVTVTKDVFTQRPSVVIRDHINAIIPNLHKIIRVKTTPKKRDDFFFKIVGDTIEYREKNNIKRNDFLDLLIEIKNKGYVEDDTPSSKASQIENEIENKSSNDIRLTRELMTAQCFVFFIAGYETSSTTLSFCLYELALNKDIQFRLQAEIDKVLANHNGEITYDAIRDMTYMHRVVQETLRKYSPLGILTRECVSDYKLPDSKVVVKKGTNVIIPVYGIHYDPDYYPDPERFDPERFTEEGKASRPHYTWLPFGEGPRNCIGMRFGLMQVKTGLTTLLSKYNFDRTSETQVPIKLTPAFLAAPLEGIKLKISKRT